MFYTSNNFQLYIQCGLKNYNDFSEQFKQSENIIIKPFINNISRIYSASDLVISRAGALAITELCYMKKAMILIPFKFAADNHQKLNAKEIQSKKACIMIEEKDLNKNKLEKTILELISSKKKLENLENNAKKASYDNCNSIIKKHINNLINE